MHAVLYTLLALALVANLVCLIGTFWIKGTFRDTTKIAAVAKCCEVVGIVLVAYLGILFAFMIWALMAKAVGVALCLLAFLLSPFVIGLAGNDYRKADRFIAWQLGAFLLSLPVLPVLVSRLL